MKKVTAVSEWIPHICAKCGKDSLELTEDSLKCMYDGWTHYLSAEQVEFLRQGLDKIKCGNQNKD